MSGTSVHHAGTPRRSQHVVVVGASAGGVDALRSLLAAMPADFPAPVLVVLHLPEAARSLLPTILDRSSPLRVRQAEDGVQLEPGLVLVAPPGRHLLTEDHRVLLSTGPRENGHRPAVDVLFRSAARTYGAGVVAVVLTGALDDGTAGLMTVHSRGGVGVVQDPTEALYPSMPRSAVERARPAHVVALEEMPALLAELVGRELPDGPPVPLPELLEVETAIARHAPVDVEEPGPLGPASGLSCPDCNGALFQVDDGGLRRYRCRVGHAWSPQSLAARQNSATETALWTALRTLEEKAAVTHDLAERAEAQGYTRSHSAYVEHAADALESAVLVRQLLERIAAGGLDLDVVAPAVDDTHE